MRVIWAAMCGRRSESAGEGAFRNSDRRVFRRNRACAKNSKGRRTGHGPRKGKGTESKETVQQADSEILGSSGGAFEDQLCGPGRGRERMGNARPHQRAPPIPAIHCLTSGARPDWLLEQPCCRRGNSPFGAKCQPPRSPATAACSVPPSPPRTRTDSTPSTGKGQRGLACLLNYRTYRQTGGGITRGSQQSQLATLLIGRVRVARGISHFLFVRGLV